MNRAPTWLRRLPLYAAVAVALTWPLVSDMGNLVVGGQRSDVWNSLWGLWFVQGNGGPWNLFTTLLDHPSGGRIAVADPLNALLAMPLTAASGPVVAYGVLVLAHLSFGGVAADALGRATGGRGFVAGIGYQLAPVCISHLHNGSSEAISIGWLPLACLALIRAVEDGRAWRSLLAGLALATCAVAGWYAGVGGWLFVGAVLLLGWRGVPLRARLLRLAPGLVLALAITLPVAKGVRGVALADDGLVDIKKDEDLARIRRTLGGADPRTFVMPGHFRSPDFVNLEGNPSDFVHTTYVGFALLGLALAFGWRREHWVWWAAGLGGAALAMGPVVVIDGYPYKLGGVALPLPYIALEKLPGFSSLSLLYRLSVITALSVAVLADRAQGRWAVVVALEALLLSPVRGLPAVTPIDRPPALAVIDSDAVLNLPATASRSFLFEQTLHGRPMVGSLNTGINISGLRVTTAARKLRNGEATPEEVVAEARKSGIRWVVVHKDVMMATATVEALGGLTRHFEPVAEDERVRVFRLY